MVFAISKFQGGVTLQRLWLRRLASAAIAFLLLLGCVPGAEAFTGEDWKLMTAGNAAAEAGDLNKALEYWTAVIPSLREGQDWENCGNYAKKAAMALDQMGRYDEALVYYEEQIFCWQKFGYGEKEMLREMRRVEQLRPRLEVFVARSTEGVEPSGLAKHEPKFGVLYGGTVDQDPAIYANLDRVAEVYGKPYGMVLIYDSVNEHGVINASPRVLAAGLPLQIAWQPEEGLDKVTEPVVRSYARALAEYGRPVFLRFGNEMNQNGVAWYGNPELYKEKFRLVARIMREEAPNVAMVWAPNYVGADFMAYYPGDEWVDWVGVSAYHDAYYLGDVNRNTISEDNYRQGKRANPLDKFKEIYEAFADRKPIMIAETGYNYTIREDFIGKLPYYDESAWAAQTARYVYTYLPMVYPRIKAVGHFNNDRVRESRKYLMSANPTLLQAVREAVAGDWYLSSLDQVPATYWQPIEQATLHGKTRVASYVWLGDRGLGRVEYRLDGRLLATRYDIPYEADIDLTGLTGPHVLTVQAYDQSGKLAAERSYSFDASAVKVELNGRVLDFAQPPVVEDGVTLVPFRAIAEALGAEVNWDAGTRTVIASRNGTELRLTIDDPVPVINGRPAEPLAVPARVVGGYTMVPARIIAQTFGMKVDWDPVRRTVVIHSPAPADEPSPADAAQP